MSNFTSTNANGIGPTHTNDADPDAISTLPVTAGRAVLVEDDVRFTLVELCRASHADTELVQALVFEGVLNPSGQAMADWCFEGASLRRARAALRLTRDLELTVAGTALVIDLLDQIEGLHAQLRRLGSQRQ